ncbi:endonuclease VII domain-containing protein [Nocardia sp. NPDC058058]|uniref:endonuclease VII domain-containing protein n=1 Tax=Nocardia sp. NPDC058058 TaxID=3346317 RepID=UPI0036D970B2
MREFTKRHKRNAWAARIEKTYGITAAEYEAILRIQGGKCAVCKRATGATRMLSVDHNHQLPPGRESVRGLLCRPCNDMVGRMRDEADAFYRAFHYLRFPPAQKVLSDQVIPLPNAE